MSIFPLQLIIIPEAVAGEITDPVDTEAVETEPVDTIRVVHEAIIPVDVDPERITEVLFVFCAVVLIQPGRLAATC